MDHIQRVLTKYGLQNGKTEKVNRNVYQITHGTHVYALKESHLTEETISGWENVYHQAYGKQLSSVLPIYLTADDDFYVHEGKNYFYLMPWMESKHADRKLMIQSVFRSIGSIHAATKETVAFQTQNVLEKFQHYQDFIQKSNERLVQYVADFELRQYMSPFELLVCTQYRDVHQSNQIIAETVNQFKDVLEHTNEWHYALCHGNLDFSHMIYHGRTYILNWENARFQNPAIDLALFFRRAICVYDDLSDEYETLFTTYLNENDLSEIELYLLSIYLSDPSDYMRKIEMYTDHQKQQTMIEHTKELQREYRRLMFGLRWAAHIKTMLAPADDPEN